MTLKHWFTEVLKKAPHIQVTDEIVLQPEERDAGHDDKPYSLNCFSGDGSLRDPYLYVAGLVSHHYAVVDMWFCLMYAAEEKPKRALIKVGGFRFELTPEGVISEIGNRTRLLP